MSKEAEKDDAPKTVALDAGDLKLLQTYGIGPYTRAIKTLEGSITDEMKKIVDLIGALGPHSGGRSSALQPLAQPHPRNAHTHTHTHTTPAPLRALQASRRATRAWRRPPCGTCATTRR